MGSSIDRAINSSALLPDLPVDTPLPLLSIIVVDSDGCGDTLNCLESIFQNPPNNDWEVILVDNCSQQSCLQDAQSRYPAVRTMQAPQRQGFSCNYNLGMKQAQGEYLLVLNNDTLVQPGALDALLAAARGHTEYAFIGPRLRGRNGRIQSFCARPLLTLPGYLARLLILDQGLPSGRLWERWLAARLERRPSGPVECISGACMLARREAVQKIGFLDEGFDFYFEDVEWCRRAWRKGWQVGFVAEAEVIHLGDQSLSKVRVWAKQSEYKSAVRYYITGSQMGALKNGLLWIATLLSFSLRWLAFSIQERLSMKAGYSAAYAVLVAWIVKQRLSAIQISPSQSDLSQPDQQMDQ